MNSRFFVGLIGLVLAALLLPAGYAGTVTATANGNWSAPGTWSAVPQAGDDVIVGAGRAVTADVTTVWMTSFTNSGSLVFTGTNTALRATNVTVSAGTVTHLPQSASTTNPAGLWVPDNRVWIVCSNLTVAGAINADYKGYQGVLNGEGTGPGKGGNNANGWGPGAGYGGIGGKSGGGVAGGMIYGSTNAPMDPGSSGSGGQGYAGGSGGGAIRIDASGQITVSGTISANGLTGPGGQAGGGSGGSIYITCRVIAGGGVISANAGNGYSSHGGGGGGGRVAIAYDAAAQQATPAPALQISAAYGSSGSVGSPGEPGTLWLADLTFYPGALVSGGYDLAVPGIATLPATNGLTVSNAWIRIGQNVELAVSSNLMVRTDARLDVRGPLSVGGDVTVLGNLTLDWGNCAPAAWSARCGGNLTVTSSTGRLHVYGGYTNVFTPSQIGSVTVGGNLLVTTNAILYPHSQWTNGGSVMFSARNVSIAAGGSINADGLGFGSGPAYGAGLGYGAGLPHSGGWGNGSGYGGKGGRGAGNDGGGPTYGSLTAPVFPGSGSFGQTVGGSGGGLVWIQAPAGAATIDGTISANGADGSTSGQNGGGSGGGVYLVCKTLQGAGTIQAKGGNGNNTSYPGGGGGGRIAVWRMNDSWTGSLSSNLVAGGTGYQNGFTGTVFWGQIPNSPALLIQLR